LLVDLPQLVQGLLDGTLARQPDMTVVGRAATSAGMADAARATHPQFVVVGLHGSELPQACRDLLAEQPRLRVLGIEADAGRAHLYELRPERVDIGEVSPADVVDAIRETAARPSYL
jgi:DNA-binding NarL/FixJ family response regulator